MTNAKFKKLKKRVGALEGKTGTAGGDLQGTYPNPLLRDAAVTTAKIADAAVTAPKIADAAVTAPKIAAGAVTADKLFLNTTRNFDFGVQAANTCTTFPFAVAGVLPTDAVIMTAPSSEPNGLITHANQGPAGMTELEICNPTAAPSADPPAADYRFTYIR